MFVHQHRDRRSTPSRTGAADFDRVIQDIENQSPIPASPVPAITMLDAMNSSAEDDHALFDKTFGGDEAPLVEGRSDTRRRNEVLNALSEGSYQKEHMSNLFAQGLNAGSLAYYEQTNPGSGWARKEATVRNELRVVLAQPPAESGASLYRGLGMSRDQYEQMIKTGQVQNHRLSFLSSSRAVAEYFASTSPGAVRVIFEIETRNLPAAARLRKGKVAHDQYKQIIDDAQVKFTPADMAVVVEAIAIPGHVFEVTSAEKVKQKSKSGLISKLFSSKSDSAAQPDTMLVRLRMTRRTLQPMQEPHSNHF